MEILTQQFLKKGNLSEHILYRVNLKTNYKLVSFVIEAVICSNIIVKKYTDVIVKPQARSFLQKAVVARNVLTTQCFLNE